MINGVTSLIDYSQLFGGGLGGFESASMDVGATCTHPRGLSAGPESTPPAMQRLTPEVALFDSSHNPLGKKGVSLTGRMCQATAEAPPPPLIPAPTPNLHPLDSPSD